MTRTRPGLQAIGELSWGPVYPVYGAAGGVQIVVDDRDDGPDEFDDDDEEGDDEGEDDEDQPAARRRPARRKASDDQGDDEEYQPPDRDTFERMRKALQRNNAENKKHRLTAKTLAKLGVNEDLESWLAERGIDPENGQPLKPGQQTGDQQDPPGDKSEERQPDQVNLQRQVRQAELRGATKAEARYKPLVAEFAARAALADAGWSGRNPDMVMRLIDLDLVDVELHEGRPIVLGIEEQISEIKDEFPDWFKTRDQSRGSAAGRRRPESRGGANEVDGGDRGRSTVRPKSWLHAASDALMGGSQ